MHLYVKFLIAYFIVLSHLYASDNTEIGVISDVVRGMSYVDQTNRGARPVDCDLAALTQTPTSLKCDVPSSNSPSSAIDVKKDLNFFVLTYDNYNQIPQDLKKRLPEFSEDQKLKKINVTIGLTNDSGLAIIGIKGDDQGFTTGFQYSVAGTYKDTVDIRLSATGNLYTEVVDGTRKTVDGVKVAEQKFRNETIFEIMASNAREGKLKYWNAAVGLVNITSKEKFGFIDGSSQQRSFHAWLDEMIKKGSNTQFTYLDDGQKDSWGAYFKAMLGLQHEFKVGDSCTVRTYAEAGAQVSNLSSHRYIEALAGAEARYKLGSGSIKAGIEASTRIHNQGQLNTISAKIAAEYQEKYEAGLVFRAQSGVLMNGPLTYNIVNTKTLKIDKTVMGYFKLYFD